MLRFEKMTLKAQEAVQAAQEVARGHENQQDRTHHLLAALSARRRCGPPLSSTLWECALRRCRRRFEREIGPIAKVQGFCPAAHGSAPERYTGRAFKEADTSKMSIFDRASVSGYRRAGSRPRRQLLKAPGATHEAILQALRECAERSA